MRVHQKLSLAVAACMAAFFASAAFALAGTAINGAYQIQPKTVPPTALAPGAAYQTYAMNASGTAWTFNSALLNDGTHIGIGGVLNSAWMETDTPASASTGGSYVNQPTGSTANAFEADLNNVPQYWVTPGGMVNALSYSVNGSTPPTANVYMPNGARISITGGIANVATSASTTSITTASYTVAASGGGTFYFTPGTTTAITLYSASQYPSRDFKFVANAPMGTNTCTITSGGGNFTTTNSTTLTLSASEPSADCISNSTTWLTSPGAPDSSYSVTASTTTTSGGLTLDHFAGTGSAKTFTLSATAVGSPLPHLGGVLQNPAGANGATAYTFTGTSVTFATAPASGTAVDIAYSTGGGANADTGYINGFQLAYSSAGTYGTVTVPGGTAYVPGANASITVAAAGLSYAPSAALTASTFYYIYLSSAGALVVSTTAPTVYIGTARKDAAGDRYLGCVLSNASGAITNFIRYGNRYLYRVASSSAPFRLLTQGKATTSTSVSCSTCVPPTSTLAIIKGVNAASQPFYTGSSDGITPAPPDTGENYVGAATYAPVISGGTATQNIVTETFDQALNTSQAFLYSYMNPPTGVGCYFDMMGYSEDR